MSLLKSTTDKTPLNFMSLLGKFLTTLSSNRWPNFHLNLGSEVDQFESKCLAIGWFSFSLFDTPVNEAQLNYYSSTLSQLNLK